MANAGLLYCTATALVVLPSTNHVYFGGATATLVVEDSSQLMMVLPVSNPSLGGILVQAIAANQTTGRVYVVNDAGLGVVTVIQDAPSNCMSTISRTSTVFPYVPQFLDVSVTVTPGCSWAVALPAPSFITPGSWVFELKHSGDPFTQPVDQRA